MLVVKVEVWPGGDETRAFEIGRANIINVDRDVETTGVVRYRATIMQNEEEIADGFVTHRRIDGAWKLIKTALQKLLY